MKQAVIAPSMLSLVYPLKEEIPGYSREDFYTDLVNEVGFSPVSFCVENWRTHPG